MEITPGRTAIALSGGAVATCVLYLMSAHTGGRLSGTEARAASTTIPPAASASMATKVPVGASLKRIVVRHQEPGDVVFSLNGEELQLEFRHEASSSATAPSKLAREGR